MAWILLLLSLSQANRILLELTKMDLVNRVSELTGLQVEVDEERTNPDRRDYNVAYCEIKKLGFETNRLL